MATNLTWWDRPGSEDTPPQSSFPACGKELGDQEATPTFHMAAVLAHGVKRDAKLLSQMAGELCSAAAEGDLLGLQRLIQAGHAVNAGWRIEGPWTSK